jgi:hypothetical protein
VGFFIFASSSAAIALLQLDFFQQSQHLRFLTSWLSLKAESADYSERVGREMYRPGHRHSWGHRRHSRSSGEGNAVIGVSSIGDAIIGAADRGSGMFADGISSCSELSQLDDNISPHQAAASRFSL